MAATRGVLRHVAGLAALLALAQAQFNSECGNARVDLVFVVDGSGSICSNQETSKGCQNWRNVLIFLNHIVDNMNIGPHLDRVGFVQFANIGKKEFGLADYTSKSALKNAISNIQHESANTNTSGGIRVMRTQLFNTADDRRDVPNVALVITDGKSTRDKEKTIPEADVSNSMGIKVYSVGVTNNVDEDEVRQISTYPQRANETYWLLKGFDVLQTSLAVSRQIFQAFCNSEGTKPPPPIASSVGCPYQNSHRWQDTCYLFKSSAQAWTGADSDCRSLGGHLAAIRQSTEQTYVSGLMRDYSSTTIWTGGREQTDKHWRYVTTGAILQGQGCYDDDEFNRDLPYKTASIDALTPQKCIAACRAAGYQYAGVQAGLHCFCGNDFGRYGLVQGCTITCPGDSRVKCGGFQANYVYLVNGAWGEWSENQPNNFGGNQNCGALYYTHQYKYADEACDRAYQYLCHIPAYPSCSGSSSNGRYVQSVPDSALHVPECYFIGERRMSWSDARSDCYERRGDLVTMTTVQEYELVARMLDSVSFNRDGLYMWAGVNKKTFTWSTGDFMWYTNFEAGSPTQVSDECISMRSASGFMWRDEPCSTRMSYFCQWDIIPTTTSTTTAAPTTTTRTTVRQITKAPTTTSTTQQPAQFEPSLGASTGIGASSDILTVLVALIVILICIMIVTICLLIYYNYMRRKTQVGVVETQSKTIKYNIYEPPVYEEVDPAPYGGDTSHYHPNINPPALQNYRLSKVHTEEVDNDYDVSAHVYAIQDEADRRAILDKKKHDTDSASEVDARKKRLTKKSKDKNGHHKQSKREHDPEAGVQEDSGPSHKSSQKRY